MQKSRSGALSTIKSRARAAWRGSDSARAKRLVDQGFAAERNGATSEALRLYREAVRIAPDFAQGHTRLAVALAAANDFAAAIAAYEDAVAADPRSAPTHYNLGMARLQGEDYAGAEASFRVALQLAPSFADAWVGLASVLERLGRDEDALAALGRAIAEHPEHAGAMFGTASLLRKAGRIEEAIAHARRALEIEPEHDRAHHQLANDLSKLGRLAEAEAALRRTLELNPGFVEAELSLAGIHSACGREGESLQTLFGVLARDPENRLARAALIGRLNVVGVTAVGKTEYDVLLQFCRDERVSLRPFASTLIELFTHYRGFAELQRCVDLDQDPLTAGTGKDGLLADTLFLAALPRLPLAHPELEQVVTHVRRWLCLQLQRAAGSNADTHPLDLICAIARQCFFSGYPLFVADDEKLALAAIREAAASVLSAPEPPACGVEAMFAVIAMYGYLDELPDCVRLVEAGGWSGSFQSVLRQQVADRQRERELADGLRAIGVVDDPTSRAVRAQYEEHPYPVWMGIHDVTPSTLESLSERLRSGSQRRAPAGSHRILVAGCGTGEHSIQVAKTYPECEVLAIDLSRSSLAYATRMTGQLGLSNIAYRQADILGLHDFEQRFALIECCGVLHHLADPMAGWRILVRLLDDASLMRIGLYSARARRNAGIGAARDFARLRGFPGTTEGVRQCRRAILGLPPEHPAKAVVGCGDFYSLNGCRDLIMHVQEHQFTPLGLGDCMDELGLRFLGFECSRETGSRFREMFPRNDAVLNLAAWDRFEEAYPATFSDMYLFWCERRH